MLLILLRHIGTKVGVFLTVDMRVVKDAGSFHLVEMDESTVKIDEFSSFLKL